MEKNRTTSIKGKRELASSRQDLDLKRLAKGLLNLLASQRQQQQLLMQRFFSLHLFRACVCVYRSLPSFFTEPPIPPESTHIRHSSNSPVDRMITLFAVFLLELTSTAVDGFE